MAHHGWVLRPTHGDGSVATGAIDLSHPFWVSCRVPAAFWNFFKAF